jgi:hypothetical protein
VLYPWLAEMPRPYLQHVAHGLNELDTVVLWWVVRRCDHDTDPFSLQGARTKGSNETNAGEDRVEDITASVSCIL